MDTKDDILIIASEQERVKMNVYEWLESPDVREYLESESTTNSPCRKRSM